MAQLEIGAATDTGQVRQENEDSLVTSSPVFAVADGMGGHLAGEVASAMAVDMLRARLAGNGPVSTAADLVEAVRAANAAIFQAAQQTVERRGMGTTVTALALLQPEKRGGEERLALANVGDSRAYVMRGGTLNQLSVDHSYVNELVSTGQITKDEARYHPHRNIVTRALGIEPDVRVDAWTFPLVRGDRFLLCSDGLVDEVHDDTIAELMAGIPEPQAVAEALIATANRHGGRDNISVIVVDVLDGQIPPDDPLDLGLEPHWADGEGEVGQWRDDLRLDDTPPSATLLTSAQGLPDPTGPLRLAPQPDLAVVELAQRLRQPERAPRFTWRTLLFVFAIAAVLVVAFTMTAVYARSGYFVSFDRADVVVYKGRPGGVLWFDPTVEVRTGKVRDELTAQDIASLVGNVEFSSLDGAVNYVSTLVPTTTLPTTAATETTTVTATTVVGGTTATTATTVAGGTAATGSAGSPPGSDPTTTTVPGAGG